MRSNNISTQVYMQSALFFFNLYLFHHDLHSFSTRRSSDLVKCPVSLADRDLPGPDRRPQHRRGPEPQARLCEHPLRSEEHTSELQSLTNLVCRLLLEKKKVNKMFFQNMTTMSLSCIFQLIH